MDRRGALRQLGNSMTDEWRPRLLIVVTSNARRGAEVFGSQLRDGLAERGWSSSIVALGPAPSGGATIAAETLGSSVSGLDRVVLGSLRRRIRTERPDVVLANGGATLRYVVAATRGMRRRPLVVYGSIGEPMYWVRNEIHRRLLREQLRRVDAVFAVSNATRRQLVEQVGVAAEKVEVASTGVSERWSALHTDPGHSPFRLVWVGSMTNEKDPLLAHQAFAEARLPSNAELRFVGAGPLRDEVSTGVAAGVDAVGSVDDIAPHLEWASALVLSSKTEGLPGVVLEALGAGLPVIATDVGGVSDVVIPGSTGIVVPPGDVAALSRAMEQLAREPELRAAMGRAGRELVSSRYLFEHSFDRYDALLRQRLGTDSMRRPAIAHLTTVDLSLRYLLMPQLTKPIELGVESIGISAAGEWVSELEAAGIRHVELTDSTRGMDLKADLRSAASLWRILRELRPDVLHTHNPKPGIYGRIIGRLAGVPIVVNTVHGLYALPEDRLAKRVVVYALEWLASRFSDAELCQSIEDYRLLRRLRLSPVDKLRHLGNGIDLTRFRPDVEVRREVRAELGVEDDTVVVGIVGRLVREKGYPELIEAFRTLDDRFRLVCVGPADPEKTDGLSQDDIDAAADDGVIFLGMRADVERLYNGFDIFILPSHREGFPRSAMEASAVGLPVIATDIRGCREVVDDGVTGRLVPVRSPEGLAAAVREIGGDDVVRRRMGEAGRQKAEVEFDERRVVRRVLGTYADVAAAKGMDRLVAALRTEADAEIIRLAVPADARFCARLHRKAISTGFLSSLGDGFLTVLYRALITDSAGIVLVAEDASGPIGFVSGIADTGAFYRRFLKRSALEAGVRAIPRLVRPSAIRKVVETLRYGGDDHVGVSAELLSMAVIEERRGRGVAARLQDSLFEAFRDRKIEAVQVVVGSDNSTAIASYRRAGFEPAGQIQVHAGESSEVLVWRP
jgi:glycosyltransferase involved in cell wall biosynthesis/ribosomal protein S18 acetylase RimI-like enzyme